MCWFLLALIVPFFLKNEVTLIQLCIVSSFTIITYFLDWLYFAPFFKNLDPSSLKHLANLINRGQAVVLILMICYFAFSYL